ncbi:MAG: hypothetical protein JHD35_07810 [Sphingopyxis sp.]|nr:hypothetical protein [Sphingopyxis sp.]
MADILQDDQVVRAVRDRLFEQLALLDKLGESLAAIELNSAIEILNERVGDTASDASVDQLQRDYCSD